MHPDARFQVEDRETLLAFVAVHPFVTIAAAVRGRPFVAQSPVVIRRLEGIGRDGEIALDFHLSRNNVLAAHVVQGFSAVVLATGADSYVSPDWYGTADQVPTWNYVSVEAEGVVAPLSADEAVTLLDDLSVQEEARLLPKAPWTRGKMTPARFEALQRGIIGCRLFVDRLEGTWKLGQNKSEAERAGVAEALGDHPVAGLMRD